MGAAGEDVMLSPAARKLFDLYIECKNCEKLNVPGIFLEHATKYKAKGGVSLLVHSRNRSPVLVTLFWADLCGLVSELVKYENTRTIGFKAKQEK
jgi:hypothetical protein